MNKLSKKIKPYLKIDKKLISFDNTEIEECKFHQNKIPISIKDIDINNTVVSNVLPFGKQDLKYFIGPKDSEKMRPLPIFCHQIVIWKKKIDETKHIYLLTKEEKILLIIWK